MTVFFPVFPSRDEETSTAGSSPASPTLCPLPLPTTQPSTLWIPLHEQQERWASFGREASSTTECAATGAAFLALSWEMSALRHHHAAWQSQQRGRSRSVSHWLGQCVHDLDEALTGWGRVLVWLERAANDDRVEAESVEQIRVVYASSVGQHQRLAQLARLLQHELLHGTPSVPVLASDSDAHQHREVQP